SLARAIPRANPLYHLAAAVRNRAPIRAAGNARSSDSHPISPVSFVNDVIPALTRAGCNAGTCHGAAAGKNGFKLSLRGYAPEMDYAAITRNLSGRRVNKITPEASLVLRKPLLDVPHMGGRVIQRDS